MLYQNACLLSLAGSAAIPWSRHWSKSFICDHCELWKAFPTLTNELFDAISGVCQMVNRFQGMSWRFLATSAGHLVLIYISITYAGIHVVDLERHRALWVYTSQLTALERPCLGHSHLELGQLQTLFVSSLCYPIQLLLGQVADCDASFWRAELGGVYVGFDRFKNDFVV